MVVVVVVVAAFIPFLFYHHHYFGDGGVRVLEFSLHSAMKYPYKLLYWQ